MEDVVGINRQQYKLTYYGSGHPTMYVWASAHVADSGWSDFQAQTEFIRKIRPSAVLHEFFEDVVYDPKTKLYTKRGTSEPAIEFQRGLEREDTLLIETKAVKELADELRHKVIGCDSRAAQYGAVPDAEREVEQADVIVKYNGTIVKPRIAIIGAIHCLQSSTLNRLLQRDEIDYAVISKLERELVLA